MAKFKSPNRGSIFTIAFLIFLIGICFFCNCADSDKDDAPSSLDTDDDDDSDAPVVDESLPQYLQDRPVLTDWSLWQGEYDRESPIPVNQIGGFAIGNGHVFSFVGARPPFATLHNIAGPHYQKNFRFFSDKIFSISHAEKTILWKKQSAFRVRDTAIMLTHSRFDDLSMWTVDFAPQGTGVDGTASANSILRTIIIHNRGERTLEGLSLKARTSVGAIQNGLIKETIPTDQRFLAAGFYSGQGYVDLLQMSQELAVPPIAPGEEFVCRFGIAFAQGVDATATYREIEKADPDMLLAATVDAWQAKTNLGARIETDNPRFDDLMEGLAQTMAVQQAAGGCFAQMSEYGYNALRDMYGVARFFPLIGRSEEYKQMLDYVWQADIARGNIGADVHIDLTFESQPDPPDWENLPTLEGRTRAESPSYLILMYKEYLNATGDWEPLEQRYAMLRHALVHQDIRNDCLLPFSDDETFRISMMLSFGHSLTDGYEDVYLSANSSFLFVVAAEFMQAVAEHLGKTDDAGQYEQLAQQVRQCTEQRYLMPAEYYAPIIDIDTFAPDPRTFMDVNTKPLWLGYLSPENEIAKANMIFAMEDSNYKDGLFYSPIARRHKLLAGLLGIYQGVVTGMTPGFQLDNLARLDHPAAMDSFLLMDQFFHDSGNVSEGQTVDDFGRLNYLHEPFGLLCDLTARYRSWEGSINAAAMIQYLFGLELDAVQGRIAIAPHLPDGWAFAAMEQARMGEARFDILVEDDGSVRRVVVDQATGPIAIDAQVSVAGDILSVKVNGQSIEPAIESEWGRSRVRILDQQVTPQQPLVIEVTH